MSSRRLYSRPFLTYLVGAGASSVGDAMSIVTVSWIGVLLEPHSPARGVAIATVAYLVPGVASGLLFSEFLHRFRPRTLVMADALWRCALFAAIAALLASGHLSLGIYALLLALAALTKPIGLGGDRVVRTELVSADDFYRANALMNGSVQVAGIAAPALAGVLISTVGASWAIAFDSASFGVFAVALTTIRGLSTTVDAPNDAQVPRRALRVIAERDISLLFALSFLFLVVYGLLVVSLPVFVKEIARTSSLTAPTVLGLTWSSLSAGAVVGLILGSRRKRLSVSIACAIVAGWGVGMLALGATTLIPSVLVAAFISGVVYGPYQPIVSTLLQLSVPRHLLAGVSSYWTSVKAIAEPAGIALGAVVVGLTSARSTILASGALSILVASSALFVRHRNPLRNIQRVQSPQP